jgi:hypothetical protein
MARQKLNSATFLKIRPLEFGVCCIGFGIRFTNHCNGAENSSLLTGVLAPELHLLSVALVSAIGFAVYCMRLGNLD